MTWLRDTGPTGCPKIDRLADLGRRLEHPGPPPGLVVGLGRGAPPQLDELLELGPVIVRAAWPTEDGDTQSQAGQSLSVHDCTTTQQVEAALLRVATNAPPNSYALIQHQLSGDVLVVLAETNGISWTERYRSGPGALDGASSPLRSGPIGSLDVRAPIEAVLEALGDGPKFGWDLEFIDTGSGPRPVQVRPLTRPLMPGAEAFVSEAGGSLPDGDLRLDGEHNPAPLSPAHAWLIERLAAARPRSGGLQVVAGWLYTRVLVRELRAGAEPDHPDDADHPDHPEDPATTFARLRDVHIPDALARWRDRHGHAARTTHLPEIPALVDSAFADFLAMIDVYLAHYAGRPKPQAGPSLATLLHGEGFRLPDEWDVGASAFNAQPPRSLTIATPRDCDGAIGEVDDVLFALGLAPVACAFRRAGALHRLGEDVFLLRGDELEHGINPATIAQRRDQWARQRALRPPRRLLDGRPVPDRPSGYLAGFGIGPRAEGPFIIRDSVADLERRPPARPSIVALPALTAPAAVVIAGLDPKPLAICTEFGGQASHAAIICRELGLSALIGCRGCTELHGHRTAVIDTALGRLLT